MTWPLVQVPEIILASQSPARKELLEEQGIIVHAVPTHCDETCSESDPLQFARILAERKMEAYLNTYPNPSIPVLTCDTIIEYKGEIIGKPATREEAERFLNLFSDDCHRVISAFTLLAGGKRYNEAEESFVFFHPLSQKDISYHLDTLDYLSCAGAYRIQKQLIPLIKEIKGHFSTVVGLPLERISAILSAPDSL